MKALWTGEEAAAATGGVARGSFVAAGVSIDSRSTAPGDLFVALRGENFDGHDFVSRAAAAGAVGAVVAQRADAGLPTVEVGDTADALIALGRAARARSRARIVAITGSVGKTGTRAMCARALERLGAVHASVASFNNRIGLPLTLARMDPQCDFAVLEMGMNRAGEIAELTGIARPDVAAITKIAPAHLEFFRDLAAIADAKAEIFAGVRDGGVAVLNRDDPFFERLADAARECGVSRAIGFGAAPDSDVRLLACEAGPEGSRVRAEVAGAAVDYTVGLPGRHWAHNSLAVLASVHALGGDAAAAAGGLETLDALPGRGRRFRTMLDGGAAEIVDDAYNASPASVAAAFDLLAATPARGRRIAAIGDMLELGADGPTLHAALADHARRADIDLVFTAGPLAAALHEALPPERRGAHAEDSAALAPLLRAALRPGDAVLVKGSHGAAMRRVVAALEATETAEAALRADSGKGGAGAL